MLEGYILHHGKILTADVPRVIFDRSDQSCPGEDGRADYLARRMG
jgi:hypothetical protein